MNARHPTPPPSALGIPHHQSPTSPDLAAELDCPPDFDAVPVQLETTGITRQKPGELWRVEEHHRDTIALKLRIGNMLEAADAVSTCCTETIIRTCCGCLEKTILLNHCDRLYCPMCAHRIAKRRQKQIEWWARRVNQPKHVVLTVRNAEFLDANYLAAVKTALTALRRSKCCRNWNGGCWSLEITNEGRGWHVHLHLLVDAKWIDSKALAKRWASLVHQDFAIVKVKDARREDYLREIVKYVVKGSNLASWTAAEVCAFVNALDHQRTFGIFGTLYGQRAEWKRALDSMRIAACTCARCGGTRFQYLSDLEHEWHQHVTGFA